MATVDARLDFRIDPSIKERIEQAAAVLGVNVSQFAILTLAERAQEILERYQTQVLSDRDRDAFLAMLDADAAPTAALAAAAKRHKARRGNGGRPRG